MVEPASRDAELLLALGRERSIFTCRISDAEKNDRNERNDRLRRVGSCWSSG